MSEKHYFIVDSENISIQEELSAKENNVIINVQNVVDKLPENLKIVFEKNGYIELIDPKVLRRYGKKFMMLTAPMFTKMMIDGHIQGTNILGKFLTHLYYVTDKKHASAEALHVAMFEFFPHYTDHKDFTITSKPRFKFELDALRRWAEKEFDMKACMKLFRAIRTNYCESKFSTRLKYLPKHLNFPKHFGTRTHLVDLAWDATHISKFVIEKYGILKCSFFLYNHVHASYDYFFWTKFSFFFFS